MQALALADVAIDDVGLRRPTLDEVFLALTGRPATDESESESVRARRRLKEPPMTITTLVPTAAVTVASAST